MYTPAELKELISEAYGTAVEKGWHETPRAFPEVIGLIHTEISEAYEDVQGLAMWADNAAEELADVLIRIFDAFGAFRLSVLDVYSYSSAYRGSTGSAWSDLAMLHRCVSLVLECHREHKPDEDIAQAFGVVITKVMAMADMYQLNVKQAVIDKMAVNKTRPYRHGGKKA